MIQEFNNNNYSQKCSENLSYKKVLGQFQEKFWRYIFQKLVVMETPELKNAILTHKTVHKQLCMFDSPMKTFPAIFVQFD